VLYFAYGANMATSVMAGRCPGHRVVGAAQLRDHRRAFVRRSLIWGAAVLDIVPSPGDTVWGALYDVPEAELSALDEAEGLGFAYRRCQVEVFSDGERLVATAYKLIEREPHELEPSSEYLELVREGAREHGVSLDDA
jgi:gamma-glutamylcyclotransferase (GGCT)/AIG2-like uncharacterized protein YtfP